jgi:hypothetical protein
VLGWFETVCFPRKRKNKLGMQEDKTEGAVLPSKCSFIINSS